MKTWLKGGLIGGGIYFFFFLVLLIIDIISYSSYTDTDRMPFFIVAAAPGIYFLRFIGARIEGGAWLLIYGLISVLFFFIIGSIIGLIIQKVRK